MFGDLFRQTQQQTAIFMQADNKPVFAIIEMHHLEELASRLSLPQDLGLVLVDDVVAATLLSLPEQSYQSQHTSVHGHCVIGFVFVLGHHVEHWVF